MAKNRTGRRPKPGSLRLKAALAPEARALRMASLLSGIASVLWPLQAALVASGLAGLLEDGGWLGLWPVVLGFVGLGAIRAGLGLIADRLLFEAGDRIVAREREAVLVREARMMLPGHEKGAGAVAALAGEKLEMLLPYVSRFAPARMRTAFLPPVILVLAFWQSWAVGLVFLITMPLIPVFMALVGMAAQETSQNQMKEIGTMNDLLVERLSALLDIRLLDAGGAVLSGFRDAAEQLRRQTMAVLRIAFLSSTVLELFAAIGVAMVAVFVGFTLLGEIGWGSYGALSPWAGIFLLLLAPDFYQPMRDLSAAWHDQASALAVAEELEAWEEAEGQSLPGEGGTAAPLPGPARIAMSGLVLGRGATRISYPDLEVAPGESLALMAPSGAGKTTLLQALAGLITPEAGRIEVAGVTLDETTADGWRARLGWMPQAPHFLSGSLRWNLTFGREGDMAAALKAAALDEVVAQLPRGVETRLGETGAGLSGGEARRLTLARAIFATPDVLLADEPTADLDEATAQAVSEGLLGLAAKGVTVIVATHDARLAARLDRVVDLSGEATA